MINLKQAIEGWHDYFLREVAAGIIDQKRFGKMSQKAIDNFLNEKTTKKKVMARIKKKLAENREALWVIKKILKKYKKK